MPVRLLRQLPRTFQVDGIIEGDNPPIDQLGGGGAPEVDQAVARLVVDRHPTAPAGWHRRHA